MPRSNRFPDPRTEQGSAAVEFLTLGVLLLVPLVYLVLTLAALQGAAFAADGAARQAARVYVLAEDDASGRTQVDAAVSTALADWRLPASAARVDLACSPDPGDCRTPRGTVRVVVRVAVALPLLPPAVAVDAPATIPVEASAAQRVSSFAVQP